MFKPSIKLLAPLPIALVGSHLSDSQGKKTSGMVAVFENLYENLWDLQQLDRDALRGAVR